MKATLDYRNKIILAPMVRVGTLPMRLLALSFGADIVYTEEIIDWKLLKSERRVNDVLNTIDYVDKSDGTIIFRTCDKEKGKVVLQLGTASAERALAVGKKVQGDVAAVDINMGCPKDFSIKGGMGVALLYDLERAKKILTTLVDNLDIPVTCKVRIMPELDDTLRTVKELESTGISAIGVHGRTKVERPRHPVHTDVIREVVQVLKIPVIANGGSQEMHKRSDILKFREACGASSVMVARAAQWNCSIFREEGPLPIEEIILQYLRLAIDYDNSPCNTKYCVQMILRDLQETTMGRKFLDSQTLEQICDVWDLAPYCRQKQLEYHNAGLQGRRQAAPQPDEQDENCPTKRQRLGNGDSEQDVVSHNVSFIRVNYSDDKELPKSKLYIYTVKNGLKLPKYESIHKDKLFRAIVLVGERRYSSSFWEKSKKYAEQSAALTCLLHLGVESREKLIANGAIIG
ncbi:tRNA-dihydrouridine(20) synthase [NAD(P)+]-like [Culex pipiens pallens]|uniref:tRNA-dihydrouridine(20) synthase [NAD(P)+]-like n=1 Tax=Culex pipiens pallens TaxID=42434 RepID=UPI0019546F98|nr:tRNA-dihydrouridine(20) synthase [NAD(P)+]-like [Culex pipiens pallens]XP_039444123.1 tRNA-dihydrouridine(20) synthase [NAD(P)+]-like [Culex pipiens pallens]